MTDKQIIIDGCDVSGCENYIGANTKTHNCTLYDGYLRPCKNADCYYKQLKHKEQECEELKLDLIEAKAHGDYLNNLALSKTLDTVSEQLDKLKKENNSLKRQLQFEFDETLLQYSNTIEDLQKQLKDSVMQKCPQCGETYLNPIGAKLYEALTEIKEIAESEMDSKELMAVQYMLNGNVDSKNKVLKQILQKINECEVDK